jgi:pyruvate/2-oxoglutarate dehydrogenase complex dihydrolipoamide dehydrogenase (E3) component
MGDNTLRALEAPGAEEGVMEQFDVIVIGAGPAGSALAGRCADGALHVALVERQLIGSECSY